MASRLFGSHLSTDGPLFCELAHDTFVSEQVPPDQPAGAPTIAGKVGRSELKRRLEAGNFRLVQVFSKDLTFAATENFKEATVHHYSRYSRQGDKSEIKINLTGADLR